MSLGPLGRLRFFGFVCPCHESDEEFVARICVQNLRSVQVQWWFRSPAEKDDAASLAAFISVLDRPLGPTLQLLCPDPTREHLSDVLASCSYFIEHGNKLYIEVPLYQIDRVELCDDGNERCEIQVSVYEDSEPNLLLRFRPTGAKTKDCPLDTVEDLCGVLQWDRVRRADLKVDMEHWEAMERMREERKRLIDEEREPTF